MCATLNGVQWESCSNNFWVSDTDAEIYGDAWFCYGLFYCADTNWFDLGFESTQPFEVGTYTLNSEATYGTVILHYTTGFLDYFYTDANHTGILEITQIDTVAEELYGTCFFDCYCPQLDSTISVSNCSFRIDYTDYR
jgi:hypothetical protein